MKAETVQAHSISFEYLSQFREWLNENREAEILDITTSGGFYDMRIIVSYQL